MPQQPDNGERWGTIMRGGPQWFSAVADLYQQLPVAAVLAGARGRGRHPAHPDTVLQDDRRAERRLLGQLLRRKLDAGQYHGGAGTAHAWAALESKLPFQAVPVVPREGELEGEVTVVDLGSGSGNACLQAIAPIRDHVREVVCIDTSRHLLDGAARRVRAGIGVPVRGVVADFLRDAGRLRARLRGSPRPLVVLCLGGTVGNYSQRQILPVLRSLLRGQDRLWIGLGFLPRRNVQPSLEAASRVYTGELNCRFSLRCLEACGDTPDWRSVVSEWSEDPEESGVRVVRVFYSFPNRVTLRVAGRCVTFNKGDRLEILQSRRYPEDAVPGLLRKYGLEVMGGNERGLQGVFRCRPSRPPAGDPGRRRAAGVP